MPPGGLRRVVIAGGTGSLGAALARRLEGKASVRVVGSRATASETSWPANLLSVAQTEVALAGAEVVVFLARTSGPRARLVQAQPSDLDLLLADSVARAVRVVKPKRLVAFFRDEEDERARTLANTRLPLSLLTGGGDDPLGPLETLTLSDEPSTLRLPPWTGATAPTEKWTGPSTVLSVQRLAKKPGWSAAQHARAYFEWLPSSAPGTNTVLGAEAYEVRSGGVSLIRLRRNSGQSSDDLEVLEVRDGALVTDTGKAVFEFRLVDGHLFTTLRDFVPAMPWLAYRASQAPMHARTMRLFGEFLKAG